MGIEIYLLNKPTTLKLIVSIKQVDTANKKSTFSPASNKNSLYTIKIYANISHFFGSAFHSKIVRKNNDRK